MADPRLETVPLNGNTALFDAALRHQVALRRYTAGEVRSILTLLEEADRDLVRQLRERLGGVRNAPQRFTERRLQALLEDVRVARREAMSALRGQLSPNLRKLSVLEHNYEAGIIQGSMPISLELASVSTPRLHSLVNSTIFGDRTLGSWYSSLSSADSVGLDRAIRLGISQGETVDQMTRRVAGTRANRYRDGVLSMTRRNAETVVRTAINGVSNAARESLWQENSDIISVLRWTATLDGRTSPVCRARDGAVTPVTEGGAIPEGYRALDPPGARPPAHPNCRSLMVAVVDGVKLVGTRPTVTDTRTGKQRQVDFRRMAREQKRPISEVRREWAEKNVGNVPAETTYNDWLRRQPAAFQDDVLGKTRGKLFRQGDMRLDEFVDSSGRRYSLNELGRRNPDVFKAAGVDPSRN